MPVPSDSMLMDEQVWQENAYLVKLLLTCGLSGSQLVPKLDSFVILISWIEACTSESASLMLQVLIGKNQSFTWILLIQFQGKLIAQLLAKGHLQHASWVLGTVAPWPSLRLYMLMLVPIGTCPQSFCRGFVWHLSYWATKDSGYQKLTKYGSCLCILCHLILLLQFKIWLTNLESDVQVQHLPIRLIVLINLHMQRNFL